MERQPEKWWRVICGWVIEGFTVFFTVLNVFLAYEYALQMLKSDKILLP
jgi:hypothetical protein